MRAPHHTAVHARRPMWMQPGGTNARPCPASPLSQAASAHQTQSQSARQQSLPPPPTARRRRLHRGPPAPQAGNATARASRAARATAARRRARRARCARATRRPCLRPRTALRCLPCWWRCRPGSAAARPPGPPWCCARARGWGDGREGSAVVWGAPARLRGWLAGALQHCKRWQAGGAADVRRCSVHSGTQATHSPISRNHSTPLLRARGRRGRGTATRVPTRAALRSRQGP